MRHAGGLGGVGVGPALALLELYGVIVEELIDGNGRQHEGNGGAGILRSDAVAQALRGGRTPRCAVWPRAKLGRSVPSAPLGIKLRPYIGGSWLDMRSA